jgi:hypothetical protein
MLSMHALRIGLLVALALAVSACGAKKQSGSVPAGAEFAPASAPAYLVMATDPNGAQWKAADRLLRRFPGRDKLLAGARNELTKQGLDWDTDVKPALPAEVHLVWLDFDLNGGDVVGYAKPKDEAKFIKLLESGTDKLVHRQIAGWTVFGSTAGPIDKFESARASGDSLSGVDAFSDAIAKQPADAAVRGWVSGEAIQAEIDKQAAGSPGMQPYQQFTTGFGKLESVSFSAAAEDRGVKLEAAYNASGLPKIDNFSAKLTDSLPAGALAYVSFGSLEDFLDRAVETAGKSSPDFEQQRAQMEQALGFSLKDDLFPLFSQESAVAVYRGSEPVPNVLFVLRVPDEAKARKIVDRAAALATLGGQASRTVTVHGVQAKEITISGAGFSILAAVADGKALVTNSKAALEQALGDSKKLSDDAVYREARDASGASDETVGFVYLNLQDGLPYVLDFAERGSPGSITPEVQANTKPLASAYFFGRKDGDRVSLSGFLTIK